MSSLTVQQAFDLALQRHRAGQATEAEALYRQILEVQPRWVEAWHMLGLLAHQTGRSDLALEFIGRALAIEPRNGAAYSNLGLVYRSVGREDEAMEAYRRALQLLPTLPEPYHNLANLLRQNGRLDEAGGLLRQAIQLRPHGVELHKNLGDVLSAAGRKAEAIAAYWEAIRLNPDFAEAYNNLGNILRGERRLSEAIQVFEQAQRLLPDSAEIQNNLAAALADDGQFAHADAAYQRALQIKPAFPQALFGLGNSLAKQGRRDEAATAFRAVLEIQPDYAKAWNNLGNLLREMGQMDEAIAAFRRTIALQPDYAEVYSNLANALKDTGDLDGAMETLRWARRLQPKNAGIQSNAIYTLHFHPRADAAALVEEQREWQRVFGQPAQRFADWSAVDRNPERRLRVGYVSAEFYYHVVGWNMLPLFKGRDRSQLEVFCYSTAVKEDTVTQQIRELSDHWRVTTDKPDLEMAEMIRRDGIDVLVDLSQHMAGNRLPVFALRPAPVQVSFAGYPESTGIEAIGWRISGRYLEDDAAAERASGERLVPIDSFWCYDSGKIELEVSEGPAKSHGFVTYGSFNNFCKVNPDVLRLWARVLAAREGSRLILLSHPGSHRQRTVEVFEREGVAASRIEFVEPRPFAEYLRLYQRLDLVLDPFPYNGHTTSLDALWMGVPVVSLAGKLAVSRAGLSQLTNLGLSDLVARTEDEYVVVATRLAGDLPRLKELRATLRSRMEASVLMDAPRFARQIEDAYRTMWRTWCAENPAA